MTLASKLEPIHVIILGLAIACGGVAWQYYKGSKTAPIHSETIPVQIPHAPLTFEEKQFRLELRKFVSSLNDAYKKMGRVFGDLLQRDKDNNQDSHKNERYFASNSLSVIRSDAAIDSLISLTQANVDDIDADLIESTTVSFIMNNYRSVQLHVWMFNQIAKIDIDHLDSLRIWLDADGRCLTELHELQSYPQAKAIKQVVEANMGIGRLWAKGQ